MATSKKKKATPPKSSKAKPKPVEWETALTYASRSKPVLTSVPRPSGAGWEPVSMKIIRGETYFAWVFMWKRKKE